MYVIPVRTSLFLKSDTLNRMLKVQCIIIFNSVSRTTMIQSILRMVINGAQDSEVVALKDPGCTSFLFSGIFNGTRSLIWVVQGIFLSDG